MTSNSRTPQGGNPILSLSHEKPQAFAMRIPFQRRSKRLQTELAGLDECDVTIGVAETAFEPSETLR